MAFCHLQKKSQETVGVEHIMSKIYVHIYCLYRKINRVASFVWPNYILLELLEHSDQAEQSFRSWIDLSIYDGIRLRLVCLLARIFIHTDFIYLCRNGIVVECNNMGGKFICVLKFFFFVCIRWNQSLLEFYGAKYWLQNSFQKIVKYHGALNLK